MSARRAPNSGDVAFCAPGDELAEVEAVGVEGQAAVAGQEPGQRELLRWGEQLLLLFDGRRGWRLDMTAPLAEHRHRAEPARAPSADPAGLSITLPSEPCLCQGPVRGRVEAALEARA